MFQVGGGERDEEELSLSLKFCVIIQAVYIITEG
jgi:hypothetical protein